jgi:Leucine-rich repeat (LRR) protein
MFGNKFWSSVENAINFFDNGELEKDDEKENYSKLEYKNQQITENIFSGSNDVNYDNIETLIFDSNELTQMNKNISNLRNLKRLEIKNNRIRLVHCNFLPDSLEELIFTNNYTIGIAGLKRGLKRINLSGNDFKNIYCEIPHTIEHFDISKNKNLALLPKVLNCCNLRFIDISHTQVSNIDALPDSIEELIATSTQITSINKFPCNLRIFIAYKSNISEINTEFPVNLKEFDIYDNNVSKLPDFPNSIETIDLSNNKLMELPYFPETITSLDLKCNFSLDIVKIKELQEKCKNASILYSEKDEEYNLNSTRQNNLMVENMFMNQMNRQKFIADFSESNPYHIIHTADYDV